MTVDILKRQQVFFKCNGILMTWTTAQVIPVVNNKAWIAFLLQDFLCIFAARFSTTHNYYTPGIPSPCLGVGLEVKI